MSGMIRQPAKGVRLWLVVVLLFGTWHCQGQADSTNSPAATNSISPFRSPEDGWFDVSGFLDQKYGFIPLVIPITEPAVGYGAAGGLAFIDKPFGEALAGHGRPDITMIGGLVPKTVLGGHCRQCAPLVRGPPTNTSRVDVFLRESGFLRHW